MTTRLGNSSCLEQRGVIRFLLAESVKSCEILSRMQRQYGPSCMSRANFYKWVQAFKDGRESITDDLRSGRPVDVSTPEAVQAVEDLIKSDRRVTLDEIATNLDISHGTVYAIVREKLRFSKVSCRWVPKMLTDDHKMQRLMASRASLRRYRKEEDVFLSRIVTTDETWVFHYEPESKRRSMEWKHVSSPVKKKFKSQKSLRKVMLTVFWDRNGPITISFLERGNTVNSENYCELLTQVKKDIKNKRRGLQSRGVILLQDNARPHTAARTLAKIEDLGWKLLTHPPYSPDLAPSDFHLFGPLKESMRGIHFQTDEEVKAAVSNWLRTQSTEFYAKGIDNLISRWNKCVAKEGDYVEK